jgi:hypothetical protein
LKVLRKLYSRQRNRCRLDSNWNCVRRDEWDCCSYGGASNILWDVCYSSNYDRAIGTRDIGVKVRAIRRISSLRLEVLLRRGDHDEVVLFGFVRQDVDFPTMRR